MCARCPKLQLFPLPFFCLVLPPQEGRLLTAWLVEREEEEKAITPLFSSPLVFSWWSLLHSSSPAPTSSLFAEEEEKEQNNLIQSPSLGGPIFSFSPLQIPSNRLIPSPLYLCNCRSNSHSDISSPPCGFTIRYKFQTTFFPPFPSSSAAEHVNFPFSCQREFFPSSSLMIYSCADFFPPPAFLHDGSSSDLPVLFGSLLAPVAVGKTLNRSGAAEPRLFPPPTFFCV